jgi:hypothetical protein
MSMSKKDFIAVADELRPFFEEPNNDDADPRAVWNPGTPDEMVDALCRAFSRLNPQFKEDRWRAYLRGEVGPSGGQVREPAPSYKSKSREQLINELAQNIEGWAESIAMYTALDGSNGASVLRWARLIRAAVADIARLTSEAV